MYVIDTKYQMVKSFPTGNQILCATSSFGIVLLILVTSIWSWTSPQVIFTLIIIWCLITSSSTFSISLMINTSQYYVTTLSLNHSLINSHWNLGIVSYFLLNVSLALNGRRNTGSFNVISTLMPLINPPKITFIKRRLSIMHLLQSLVPLLILI